jgi:hypothetical protein
MMQFSSCALFQGTNLSDKKVEELVDYLKGTGEGKGRLGINQHQYLFGFEAVLKENHDWILAANIPLHGEELLILRDLRKAKVADNEGESLEARIENGIADYLKSQKKSPKLAKLFLVELRQMMRLVLHKEIGEKVSCHHNECKIGDSVYLVEAKSQQLSIKKILPSDFEIEYIAQNLTDSIFRRGNIFLHSKTSSQPREPLLSLELFWN